MVRASADPRLVADLHAKYEALSRKYASLVAWVSHERQVGMLAARAGRWGLRANHGGVAVIRQGRVELANKRWRELCALAGPWQLLAVEGRRARAYKSLELLALGEAGQLGEGDRPRRCLCGARAFELRIERSRAEVLVQIYDVSDQARDEEELQQAHEALLQKEHLRVLGELSAAVVHEVGNTLRSISLRLESAASSDRKLPSATLQAMHRAVTAALGTLRTLNDVARSGRLLIGPVDLGECIDGAVSLLELEARAGAAPLRVVRSKGPLPLVHGTLPELSHIFINLLRNARAVMPGGGAVHISHARKGRLLVVRVRDEGPGIAPDRYLKLFQPAQKGGTGGMGLWLAASALRRFGGSITASNTPRGALFTLALPVAELSVSPARRQAPAPSSAPGGSGARAAPRPARALRSARQS